MVHGSCMTPAQSRNVERLTGSLPYSWLYMMPLAKRMAREGFVVLVIGMREDTLSLAEKDPGFGKGANIAAKNLLKANFMTWSTLTYARALSVAIDHLCEAAPQELGLSVDTSRIGLVGHSVGAAGVLRAAASECAGRIQAVVALNPSHLNVDSVCDRVAEVKQYLKGKNHSGEYGDGDIPHLGAVKAPTLVYGSQAEYNTQSVEPWLFAYLTGNTMASMWPKPSSVFAQLGAKTKELYVDNTTSVSSTKAHSWLGSGFLPHTLETFAAGHPYLVVSSFLRRHLAGSDEAPPERPANAKEWVRASA